MAGEKPDVLLVGAKKPVMIKGFEGKVTLHHWLDLKDRDAFVKDAGKKIRAIAIAYTANKVDEKFLKQFPNLEQVSSFGVGYDHIDAAWAGAHGIIVTNTPEVLNEEVADTAIGLLLCTVREFPQSDRFVRAGKWPQGQYPLTKATLRDRTVGIVGMGRIGKAIARRLDAFGVPVVYHSRNPQPGVNYKYYPKLLDMARDVDTLMVIVPGGASTQNMINAEVLKALGPRGVVINMARGSVVDEPALIEALKNRTIYSAGLDVFAKEPDVPRELIEMDHVVLFPHLGSSTEVTRAAMDQLVVDNILAWAAGKPPLTPVPETPWPPKR
ncbi:MAG TPA: 2-hydroxyacid dehydrogenase [Pseudolabrys sp.]|jgi:lactate dehydrogenase-like 2-hydroxyacid dehydrogenase|nr:2-hydroxyacid dehydrogenase [Pseudolabrys sp.]